jgi:hypothetical protein
MTVSTGTTPVQPALTGLESTLVLPARQSHESQPDRNAAGAALYRSALAVGAGITPRTATSKTTVGERPARRRYWSVRDLSRRIWVGRGYELLRHLIRAGILPATKSARSWWIDDRDAAGLMAAFDDRAGKVRAFHGLERWLRERCDVTELNPETAAQVGAAGFGWRGRLYVPKAVHAVIDRDASAEDTSAEDVPDEDTTAEAMSA